MCALRSGQPYSKPDRTPNPNPNPGPIPNRNSRQVGHSLQLFVYNTQPSAPMKKMREAVVINPKILDYGELTLTLTSTNPKPNPNPDPNPNPNPNPNPRSSTTAS